MSDNKERENFAARLQEEGYEVERIFSPGFSVHETHESNGDYVVTLLGADGKSIESVRVAAETLKFYDAYLGGAEQLRLERRKNLEVLGEKMSAARAS